MINDSKKTKQMILGSHKNNPLKKLCWCAEIESVSVFTLLDIHISHDLKDRNTNAIFKKASSRLHFLKLLQEVQLSQRGRAKARCFDCDRRTDGIASAK